MSMNLQAVNPVARVIALLVFTTPLLVSIDLVSALVSLACTIIGAPILGVSYRVLFRRGLPIVLIAPVSGISMALYGRPEGREYFSVAFAHVTDNSLGLAAAIMVRVLAVGLPVIVLLGTIDPTELGDGLSQILKFPPRFVIGTVAGARLVSLFQRDWEAMRRARRVRGLDGHNRFWPCAGARSWPPPWRPGGSGRMCPARGRGNPGGGGRKPCWWWRALSPGPCPSSLRCGAARSGSWGPETP